MPILAEKAKATAKEKAAGKQENRKHTILIRVIAGLMAVTMISGILVYFQTDVTINPQKEENKAARLAARQLLEDNDYVNASRFKRMTSYTGNLLRVKNSTESYLQAADIAIAEENYQEAVSLTAKAIELYSGTDNDTKADLYFQMGYLHVMEEEYPDAMEWLNKGLSLKDSPEARMVRAQVQLNLDNPDMNAALEDVAFYMETVKDAGENLPDLINVYEAAGEYGTAALMYTRLIGEDPRADYYLQRAYCYVKMAAADQDPSKMALAAADRDSYERAGGTEIAAADVMLGNGWLETKQYPEARDRFIAALNEGYSKPETLYFYIVICSYVSNDFVQAAGYGDRMIGLISRGEGGKAATMALENTTGKIEIRMEEIDFPSLCRMTGASYMQTGDFDRAEECLTAGLNENPDMPYVHYLRGTCRMRMARYAEAETDFCDAMKTGDSERAEERLTAELNEKLNIPYVHYFRGVCRMMVERYAEAETDFGDAIAGGAETEDSHYSRALCRIKQGNTADALEDLEWILNYGTDEERIRNASGMKDQLMAGETR